MVKELACIRDPRPKQTGKTPLMGTGDALHLRHCASGV